MFCRNCGEELGGEANFCPHCGKPRTGDASAISPDISTPRGPMAPKTRKNRFLWNYHTYDWAGHCPSCRLVHTFETARCPNDDAPLVVAFNCWRWNPFRFPMQTAHLRCANNCGYTATGFGCTRDGTMVLGQSIEFRPSTLRVFTYNLRNVIETVLFIAMGVPFVYLVADSMLHPENWLQNAPQERWGGQAFKWSMAMFFFLASLNLLKDHLLESWWWKFVRTFDLERVQRR